MSGVIGVAVAPLRKEPAHESECVTQGLHGEAFTVLETSADGSWQRVRMARDGYQGWLRSWYGAPAPGEAPRLRVKTRSADVRKTPKGGGEVLVSLPWQAELWEIERSGTWVQVRLASGESGHVAARQVVGDWPPGGVATSARLWRTAVGLLGVPYLWGGRSTGGYDCSGLVQAVLGWHGLAVPRDTRDQLSATGFRRPREASETLRAGKGDLLFFGPSPERATHVALSGGNGEFVHAYGEVRLGSLSRSSQHYVPELDSIYLGRTAWASLARLRTESVGISP